MKKDLTPVQRHRYNAHKKGYRRRDYYATPIEHKEIKLLLARLRAE